MINMDKMREIQDIILNGCNNCSFMWCDRKDCLCSNFRILNIIEEMYNEIQS